MKSTIAILLGSCWLVSGCGGAADAPDQQATTRNSVAAVDTPQDAAAAPDPAVATVTNMSAGAPPVAGAMSSATPGSTPPGPTPPGPTSCAAEIGRAAAARRVAICRNVSPATHPPCNVANSCAMIEDEIARSCALGDGQDTPMAGCTTPPDGMQAAADVVRRYYAALNARDYATAWQQWGDNGAPGQTLAAFRQGFAHTASTEVKIGKLEPGSGGAGSIYQPVPVVVDATLDDGSHQRFAGTYTIRRVNGVDGATAAQLRWHIGSATLKRVAAR